MTEKQQKYIQLRIANPTLPKTECVKLAGYSPITHAENIEKSPAVRAYAEQMQEAARKAGLNPLKMAKTLQRAMDRSIVDPGADNTAIKAVRVAGQLLGIGGQSAEGNGNVTVHNTLINILNKVSE